MTNNQEPNMWWLYQDGRTTGPHDQHFILQELRSDSLSPETPICPVGSEEWKPIRAWREFANFRTTGTPPPLPSQAVSTKDSPFTNPQLPKMANWICLYTILFNPLIMVFDWLNCCVFRGWLPYGNSKIFEFDLFMTLAGEAFSLVLTCVLIYGGLQLRTLRKSGATIIKTALWTNYAFIGIWLCVYLTGEFILGGDNDYPENSITETVVLLFSLAIGVGQFVFDIVALVWLLKHTKNLPMTDN